MVLPEITERERFGNLFLLTKKLWGQKFDSLDELTDALTKNITNINFFDYNLLPQNSEPGHEIYSPFNYIVAKIGTEKIETVESIGFIVELEKKFRVGPPYFEERKFSSSFGMIPGYVLYESPEKKYHLLTHQNS